MAIHPADFSKIFHCSYVHAPKYARCVSSSNVFRIWPSYIVTKGSIAFNAMQRSDEKLLLRMKISLISCDFESFDKIGELEVDVDFLNTNHRGLVEDEKEFLTEALQTLDKSILSLEQFILFDLHGQRFRLRMNDIKNNAGENVPRGVVTESTKLSSYERTTQHVFRRGK